MSSEYSRKKKQKQKQHIVIYLIRRDHEKPEHTWISLQCCDDFVHVHLLMGVPNTSAESEGKLRQKSDKSAGKLVFGNAGGGLNSSARAGVFLRSQQVCN